MTRALQWPTLNLGDVVSLQRGFDLPAQQRRPGPFPVLTSGEGGGFHAEGPISGPGVTIGRATNLGQPKWSESDFWPHNTTLFVRDFHGNHPRWVFHLFESLDLSGYDSGSVQPMLNRNYVARVQVRVPPLDEQRAIAEVLGALDDKIAANTRLVSTVLQLTDAHFASASAHSMLSDLKFADVADVGGGGTPKTKVEEYWGDEVNWATPTDVTALHGPYLRSTSRRITQAGLDNCSSALYPAGSIFMTSRATIGAFAVPQTPMAVNQGFIVVNSQGDVPRWWLFHEMQRRVPEFVSHANGATFLELSRGKFKNFHVHLAAIDVMQSFAETADALHSRAAAADTESSALAETRDALLPLLMSGKVTVRDAESVVEGVV